MASPISLLVAKRSRKSLVGRLLGGRRLRARKLLLREAGAALGAERPVGRLSLAAVVVRAKAVEEEAEEAAEDQVFPAGGRSDHQNCFILAS